MNARFSVVFGASLTQFTVIGLLFSYGLFFKVFETEFGWSRTLLSGCTALAFLIMGVLAMVGGRLSDRFGPRIVLAATGVIYGAGYVLISRITQPWQLYLIFGTFIGLGLSTHDVVTLSTIGRWFDRRRGVMTGVVKVGTALGQIAIPPLVAFLILTQGWRPAVAILGFGAMLMLVLAALLMKNPPEPVSATSLGGQSGMTFAEARWDRIFWTICAIQFLLFPSLTTMPLHIAVHAMDLGMSPTRAATLLSVIGASSIAGRLVVGGLVDKGGGKIAYLLCSSSLIVSLTALMFSESHLTLYAVVTVYGFGHGGFFTAVSPTIAEYFGLRAHGALFGTVLFFGTIGGSIGPILSGFAFDVTGSYQIAFFSLLILAVVGMALVLSLPAPGRRENPAPE